MRRLDVLIDEARRDTDNSSYSSTHGIQQEEIVGHFNKAQRRIHSLIMKEYPIGVLEKKKDQSCSLGVSEYDIPFDCYLGSRISKVFYSPTSNEKDFYPLDQITDSEMVYGETGHPRKYLRESSKVILVPAPQSSSGKIRIRYQKEMPRLDLRRGSVASVTLTSSGITSLTLTTGATLDTTALAKDNYLTVVDKNGVIKMRRIPFTAINSGTGVVTIEGGFEFEDGETIAVGDYVCSGKNSTTHSEMPDSVEEYLLEFTKWKLQKRDSSNDAMEQNAELKEMEQDIVANFSIPDTDNDRVPILDATYMTDEEYC